MAVKNCKRWLIRQGENSYPDRDDSDGDGAPDNKDDRPLMADFCQVAKLNSKFSDHYLNIVGDGNTYYGGYQNWWKDKAFFEGDSEGLIGQEKMRYDKYFRLAELGCGTIAMSDAELYMTIQNSGYTLSVDSLIDTNFQQTRLCNKNTYMDYVEMLYGKKYGVYGDSLSLNVGVYPKQMTSGFSAFLKTNSNPNTNVKWARYNGESFDKQKQDILNDIEGMLNKDIPVV